MFFKQVNSSPGFALPRFSGEALVGVELVQGAGLPGISARYGVQKIREHTAQNWDCPQKLGVQGSRPLTTQCPPHQPFAICTLLVSWTALVLTQSPRESWIWSLQ